jgi:polysaccharide export outer membrane protein
MDLLAGATKDQDMTQRAFFAIVALLAALPASAQQPAPSVPEVPADYLIGAQDRLVITSYDQSDLSGRFVVETDGTFTFPLLGRVRASGMTLQTFEASLRQQLIEAGFFKNPQITVAVDQYRSRKIYVLGEVRKPGVLPISGAMRLVEALALADSLQPTAGPEVVIIPSAYDDSAPRRREDRAVRIQLADLENGDITANVLLNDGDTILVPRAEQVYVFGQVKNPGAYSMRQDVTVLQALSLAGGVTDRGATGRIEIVRMVGGENKEIRTDLTDAVRPGDTVVVPERYF